jgi:hypothetical protein
MLNIFSNFFKKKSDEDTKNESSDKNNKAVKLTDINVQKTGDVLSKNNSELRIQR